MNNLINKILFTAIFIALCCSSDAAIEPTSGRYYNQVTDLSVKVVGGQISWNRLYEEGRWKFNQPWDSLIFEIDSNDGSILRIIRGGDSYEKLDSAGTIFKFGKRKRIRKNSSNSGWTWNDRKGNFMNYDLSGRTESAGNTKGFSVSFVYSGNKLIGVKDANNSNVLTITYYEGTDNIETVFDYSGREVRYLWSDVDATSTPVRYKLDKVTDARGLDWEYGYSSQVNQDGYAEINLIRDPENRETRIHYGSSGRVKKVTNAMNQSTHYTFDYIKSRKEYYIKTVFPGGRIVESWYERDGGIKRTDENGITLTSVTKDLRKELIKDTLGRVTTNEYDEFRNLVRTIYPDGSTISATYDVSNSNVLTRTDESGTITKYKYFAGSGLLEEVIEAEGSDVEKVTKYTYDSFGQVMKMTQVGDGVTESAITTFDSYDEYGNLTKLINAEGHETEYTLHDAMGNVLNMIDGRDKTWVYTFDNHGNKTSESNPLGHTINYEYDGVGNLILITYPDTSTNVFSYDALNRKIKTINELGAAYSYTYDATGNLISTKEPSNSVTSFKYDSFKRLIETKDQDGNIVTYQYAMNNLNQVGLLSFHSPIVVTHVGLYEQKNTFDLRGRVLEQKVTYEESGQIKNDVIKYKYDVNGNVIELTDAENRVLKFSYDKLNRVTSRTDALTNVTEMNYDSRNNLINLKNALNNEYVFKYDKLNRKVEEINPSLKSKKYSYDENNNISNLILPSGKEIEFLHNDINRNNRMNFYNSMNQVEKSVLFEYDLRGNLLNYDDGISRGDYTYNKANQKLTEVVNYDNQLFSYSYTYNINGRKESFTDTENITYRFNYHSNGALNNVVIPNEGNINYDNFKWFNPQTITYPGGVIRNVNYDPMSRITSISVDDQNSNNIMSHLYSYSPVGNLQGKNTEIGNYNYEYDDVDRVTEATYPTLDSEIFTYDALGNRLTDTETNATEWLYGIDNELLNSVANQYEYDENGNVIIEKNDAGQIIRSFDYSSENRLIAVKDENGNLISTYYYDPFGKRLSKTIYDPNGESTTYFQYSDDGLIAEKKGGLIVSYLLHPQKSWSTEPILKRVEGQYYYYQIDQIGTPLLLHSKDGTIVNSKEMEAFGDIRFLINTIEDNLGFPGQYWDSETQTFYNFMRNYNPATGRYTQADPIGMKGGYNYYAYALSSPTSLIDPLGLKTQGRWTISPRPEFNFSCSGSDCIQMNLDEGYLVRIQYEITGKATVDYAVHCWDDCTGEQWDRSNSAIIGPITYKGGFNVPWWCGAIPIMMKEVGFYKRYTNSATLGCYAALLWNVSNALADAFEALMDTVWQEGWAFAERLNDYGPVAICERLKY